MCAAGQPGSSASPCIAAPSGAASGAACGCRHPGHEAPLALPCACACGLQVSLSLSQRPRTATSNMSKEEFLGAVEATKEYIQVRAVGGACGSRWRWCVCALG